MSDKEFEERFIRKKAKESASRPRGEVGRITADTALRLEGEKCGILMNLQAMQKRKESKRAENALA